MTESLVTGSVADITENEDGQLVASIVIDSVYQTTAKQILKDNKSPVVLARLTEEANKKNGPYGKLARALVQSGFFRKPELWRALGTDAQYLEWLKLQKCARTNEYGNENNQIIPAHVRRVSKGAGTGIKPEFSAIPLNNFHHQQQHQKGEEYVSPFNFFTSKAYQNYAQRNGIPEYNYHEPRYWWEWQAEVWAERWAQERFREYLKDKYSIHSLTWLKPEVMLELAAENDITKLVPSIYTRGNDETP